MRLELHTDATVELSSLVALFPEVAIARVAARDPRALTSERWRADDLDFWAFDRGLDELVARNEPVRLSGGADAAVIVREVLTRAQRLAPRRNAASATAWFDRVLEEHRALHEQHDLGKPLVRADLDHAVDAWQWSLRLDPDAPAAVQLATLLHDIERLSSEADERIEHRAADYQAFKDAHALAGARLARALCDRSGVPAEIAASAAALIATHERIGATCAIRAINDADALSFFSLNSPGYLAYFGAAQTANKVAYTLARMTEAARRELPALRLPVVIRDRIAHELQLA